MPSERRLPTVAILIPCYNEEEVIEKTFSEANKILERLIGEKKINKRSYITFIDDGSTDRTWEIIKSLHKKYPYRVKGLKLSKNAGHQNALMAGILSFDYDACITMDADLQDPPEVIKEMVEKYIEGYEVVYGVRSNRETDSLFKRTSAEFFYDLMKWLGVELVKNHADFRLLGSKAVKALSFYGETKLFLRGIVPSLGFKSTSVFYERQRRAGGESKYTLRKMMSFAWEGITSFSIFPLRIITIVGAFIFFISLLLSFWALFLKITGRSVAGWASIVLPLYILGGLNMLFLGIIGEYVGKTYIETKRRPRFIVEEKLD